jgi:hypothetical protein
MMVQRDDSRNILIVGKESNLSIYLAIRFAEANWKSERISLRHISSLDSTQRKALWRELSKDYRCIIFSGAAIDPSLGEKTLDFLNHQIPLEAIRSTTDLHDNNMVVTIGSALEGIAIHNPYIASKHKLGERALEKTYSGWIHVRTHTLVGEQPPPSHMLLGQLLIALRNQSDFTIHGTHQVREYIHYEQFAGFLSEMIGDYVTCPSKTLQVGGKEITKVHELVQTLMSKFNPSSKLLIDTSLAWQTDQTLERLRTNEVILRNPKAEILVSELVEQWLRREN